MANAIPEPILRSSGNVYAPREDSYLLAEAVREYAFGNVLDLGTGSGIQGITSALKGCKVTFSDIDGEALMLAKSNALLNNVNGTFIQSDMFSKIKGGFDTIIFNPPYLPANETKGERAFDGGEKGRRYIDIFLKEYKKHLNKKGIALLLESSINDWEADSKKFNAEVVGKAHYFFEDLVVLLLR